MPKLGTRTRIVAAALAAAALSVIAAGSATAAPAKHSGTTLIGAGSSFVAPLVSQWIPAVGSAFGYELQYSPIGSGGGISAIQARTVDFGASDAPLTPDQFTACKGCVQIPWALSATSVIYNLDGVKNNLKIDGPTLASIFLGNIKTWNDPAIAKQNPGVNLPSTAIATVHRSDNSGTTYNFSDYLSTVSPAWKSGLGVGVAVNWPSGTGARGSAGVAAAVGQTPGGIGYVDIAYAKANHLKFMSVKNRSGKYTLARPSRHPRGRHERPEAGPDDEPALDRQPAEEVRPGIPDLDLHLRDRARAVDEGCGHEEVPVLGRDEGPDVRTEAALPADPEERPRRRGEDDHEDPQLGHGCPQLI